MPRCNWKATRSQSDFSESFVKIFNHICALVVNWPTIATVFSKADVVFKQLLVYYLNLPFLATQGVDFLLILLVVWMAIHMRIDDECTQIIVYLGVRSILHNFNDVETGKNGVRKVDIVCEIECLVVLPLQRVSCCDDTASGPQLSYDTCLRYRNGLLLHSFMDGSSVMFIHFIKLID